MADSMVGGTGSIQSDSTITREELRSPNPWLSRAVLRSYREIYSLETAFVLMDGANSSASSCRSAAAGPAAGTGCRRSGPARGASRSTENGGRWGASYSRLLPLANPCVDRGQPLRESSLWCMLGATVVPSNESPTIPVAGRSGRIRSGGPNQRIHRPRYQVELP